MLAFTMSLDDFVITHFTKDRESIPSPQKFTQRCEKGSSRKFYALSTIMFVTVLVLLILINYSPKEKRRNQKEAGEKAVKGKESTVPPCDPGSDLRSFLCSAAFITHRKAI